MPPAEVQNPVGGTDRKQLTDKVHLPLRYLIIADRAGIGEEVELIEYRFPPFGVHFDGHDGSGLAPKSNSPSEAIIAGLPPQGCMRAISSSSSSILTISSSSPESHIFSNIRQSDHRA